jgi:hypothetical protein
MRIKLSHILDYDQAHIVVRWLDAKCGYRVEYKWEKGAGIIIDLPEDPEIRAEFMLTWG